MATTRKYEHPPLVEAICEFIFELDNPQDATIPGAFYSVVKEDFPIKKQRASPLYLATQSEDVSLAPMTQFYNADESLVIQVAHNLVAFNSLKNYPHWESFKPFITNSLAKYLTVVTPKAIKKISLRAVNKIDIPVAQMDLIHYFKLLPTKPDNIKTEITALDVLVETQLVDQRDVLAMKLFSVLSDKSESSSFGLQLEYIMNKREGLPMTMSEIESWLEIAHSELNNAFEAAITEETRKLFS